VDNSAEWSLAEFQRLCRARDLAAYRVVGAVDAVLTYFEVQDFAEAEKSLRRARADYEQTDQAINEFRAQYFSFPAPKKESQSDGNRPAAA
jgi:hypothetical protein